MKKLLSLLEDNSGGLSSTRFQMLLWTIGVLVIWSFMAVKIATTPIPPKYLKDEVNPNVVYVEKSIPSLPAIPETVLILLLGISSAKVVQRFGEKGEIEAEKTDQ